MSDLTEAEYRAIPALSASGMKHLLRSPLHYRHYIDHPSPRAEFDFGHAVHADVLGVGQPLVEIPDELLSGATRSISSAEAKAWVAAARERGEVPLKASAIEAVKTCADAVRAHATSAWLLGLPGASEVPFVAEYEDSGVTIKSRLDRVATLPDGRLVNIDLKTTSDVRIGKLRRSIEDFGYDVQAAVYEWQLATANPGAKIAPTHLIFVEQDQPHEVRVVQLAHEDWRNGARAKMRRAIALYKRCIETGEWPGDDDGTGAAESILPRPYYLADIELEDE